MMFYMAQLIEALRMTSGEKAYLKRILQRACSDWAGTDGDERVWHDHQGHHVHQANFYYVADTNIGWVLEEAARLRVVCFSKRCSRRIMEGWRLQNEGCARLYVSVCFTVSLAFIVLVAACGFCIFVLFVFLMVRVFCLFPFFFVDVSVYILN